MTQEGTRAAATRSPCTQPSGARSPPPPAAAASAAASRASSSSGTTPNASCAWRNICAKCGMRRGEHDRPYAGVRDDLLPPRKRSTFRRTGVFQLLQSLGGGGGGGEEEKREAALRPLPLEEGPSCWSGGSAITKGKRRPRRKRADQLLCCELFKFE